jgi:hypothetical protein
VGQVRVANVTTHCGLEIIYLPIAGTFWKSANPISAGVPDEWAGLVSRESLDLRLERIDPTTLSVSAVGSNHFETYMPIGSPPLCD